MKDIESKIKGLIEKSFAKRVDDIEKSIALSLKAIELCDNKIYDSLKAKAHTQLGLFYMITGRYEESFNISQKSIQYYEIQKDYLGIAACKYNLAGFYYKTNNFQLGVVYLIDALLIYKNHNDYFNISRCEKALGAIYQFTGDEQKAIQSHKNAIKAAKKINDLDLESNVYNNLSAIYLKNNNPELAKEIIEKSISIKGKTGDKRGLAYAIYGKGKVFLYRKEYANAEANLLAAKEIHQQMNDCTGVAMAYTKLARLYFEAKNFPQTRHYITIGLEICNKFNIVLLKIKLLYLSYLFDKSQNNQENALRNLELYLIEKESVFNTQNIKIVENYELLVRMQNMQKETDFQTERTKLIAKNNKTEQLAKVRQEFLSTMSHEIRTPLNAILTISKMLNEQSTFEDKKLLSALEFSAEHLMQIINNILDFTKLDLGKMTLDKQPINIKNFIKSLGDIYQLQASSKNIEFELIIDPELNDIYLIDGSRIAQITGNLISNAIKFTEVGLVKLEVNLIQQQQDYDLVSFTISDTGIGIEKENLDKIFEYFSQLKNGITRKNDGAGLGLAITKKIIELHNSQINVRSIQGKGSTFSFEIKLEKSTEKIIVPTENTIENEKELKILLAEDNAINAMIAKKLLSSWGFQVTHAKDGMEATEIAKREKFDAILMDIHMPVLDGFEAAKNIRTLENLNKETPIFGLTADISAKDNNQYNNYFNGFYLKPIESEKLKFALFALK